MDINQEDVIVDAKIIESSDVKPSNTKTEKEATPAKSEQSLGEIKDQIKADIKDIAKQLSLAAKYFAYSKKIKKEKADFIKSVKEEAPEVEVEYLQPETPEKKSQKRDGIDIVMGGRKALLYRLLRESMKSSKELQSMALKDILNQHLLRLQIFYCFQRQRRLRICYL